MKSAIKPKIKPHNSFFLNFSLFMGKEKFTDCRALTT